ncbi:MAG TPA: NAD(P)/FAD-dependent oxidoreductase [Candidatus Competibacteraceae bacterium]|nr:NAD(P)/FAD-dependent oxidoreductase [Candidatus Competibacteraceae bacterium]MCP5134360.1 NAD(P)/FAD-dependent oxidoreductase [Gammaproteobacteria bacterium]HPF58907.1 NAD(P)/FAD-dependent oxidoreductase [Candidatus Competibacteraceae bacterium]HRY18391.1 NAD(P)/FAD-dependent oxidoreductase [Candidatus Competibacteraceae bacterium]
MESIDTVVIGAGVVGLAIARELAGAGREVLILEACERFGTQISSRNSEVIHAGIYYPPGSLKARLCVDGKERLYRYCAERGIAHRRTGKLLVACDVSELPHLASYAERSAANGVPLVSLTSAGIHRLEPAVRAIAGLYSPSTGIIDSHGLMLALLGDAEQAGAILVTHTPLVAGHITPGGIILQTGGDAPCELQCRVVVNSAGLFAQDVARRLAGFPMNQIPPAFYAKGHYFTMGGRSPFQHLVYPMPDRAGLGIHVTLDLGGQCKFGPDVSGWPVTPDDVFEPGLEDKFYWAIRRYYPDLPDGALQPGYTGIRPKITGPAEAAGDFLIQGPSVHGVAGLVNLFGIESPGLTASLAIARQVLYELKGCFGSSIVGY